MPTTQNLSLSGFIPAGITAAAFAAGAVPLLRAGIQVDRATGDLPASTTGALFTVSGGPILVPLIVGVVTTIIQAQACLYSLEADPTVTGANVALCGTLDINAKAVGTYFSITGTLATAMSSGLAVIGQAGALIIPVGTIVQKTSATNTGQVAWSLFYVPLVAGATVVAA